MNSKQQLREILHTHTKCHILKFFGRVSSSYLRMFLWGAFNAIETQQRFDYSDYHKGEGVVPLTT